MHGGPGGQTTRAHSAVIQYLANHGYVVLGINNRGSSGYGKTFFAADDGKHGREPLWDTLAAKKYLQSLDYVDPERIGIIGGSYGGYMTAAALAFHADKIARPMLVLQGANDPRVIQVESDDIVAAVRKNGVPVEYVVFPDEGHGFSKKKNQIEGYGKVLAFLDKYLKGDGAN